MHIPSVARPGEPEETQGERDPARDDGRKTPFRDGDVVIGGEFPVVARLQKNDDTACGELADDHTEEWKSTDARVHAVNSLKDDWIRGQEQIKQAINKGHVNTQQENDGFGSQNP